MSQWYTCKVNLAGPAANGVETRVPVVYINLADQSGKFGGTWFFASENSRNEMLAVALSAISLGKNVAADLEPPNAGGTPYTECHRLYIIA